MSSQSGTHPSPDKTDGRDEIARLPEPPSLTSSLPARAAATALVILATVTFAVRLGNTSSRNDFTQDYVSARALTHGSTPYAPTKQLVDRFLGPRSDFYQDTAGRNPHPPPLIILLAPLSFLPYAAAWTIWKILIAFGFAGSIALIGRALGFSLRDSIVLGIASLLIPSAQQELIYGGTTVVVLVLLTAIWVLLERGSDTSAGTSAGAATAVKLFPGLLIIWFLKLKRERAAAVAICVGVAITALSLAIFGWQGFRDFFSSSRDDFGRFKGAPINMSLPSLVFRVLHGTPAGVLALSLTFVLLAVALTTRGNLSGPYWSAIPWMILLSPLAWYASLMIPVVLVATVRLARAKRLRPWHLILFAAACFGTLATVGPQATGTTNTILDLIPTVAVAVYALLDAWPRRTAQIT